jgi:hypothetical protein
MIRRLKTQNTLAIVVLLTCIICLQLGCKSYTNPLIESRTLIPVGTSRDEAIRVLSEKSWYYQDCTHGGSGSDLFFFGSHKYDEAFIVIVSYDRFDDNRSVSSLFGFEYYAWQTAYADCIDKNRFEK